MFAIKDSENGTHINLFPNVDFIDCTNTILNLVICATACVLIVTSFDIK